MAAQVLLSLFLGLVIQLCCPSSALDDGLARTPPMGWRNWNAFMENINQATMEKAMDEMVRKGPNGVSLRDVGYYDVGLDDYWQACGQGQRGGFHAKDGKPLVNTTLFPSLAAMVSHGHKLNLSVGWYANNCYCAESGFSDAEVDLHQTMDVEAALEYGFDSIKLDGCGQEQNLTRWVELFQHASPNKSIMIENCHWGGDLATPTSCPYHFARTSPDVTIGKGMAGWPQVWLNMQTMGRSNGIARPGCWNYPDMLETGNFMGTGQSASEDRTTFGMWSIASSPLILSYDLTDEARRGRVWHIITNQDAIAVNQAWAGDAGRLVYSWDPVAEGQVMYLWSDFCDDFDETQNGWFVDPTTNEVKFNTGAASQNDLCLDMQSSVDPAFATLTGCSHARHKKLVYQANGQIKEATPNGRGRCLTPLNYMWSAGPGFVLMDCEPITNHNVFGAQHFFVGVATNGNKFLHQNGHCLTVRTSAPMNSNVMQMWAKRIRGVGDNETAFDTLTGREHLLHIDRVARKFDDGVEDAPMQAVLLVNADEQDPHEFAFSEYIVRKVFGPDASANGEPVVSVYDVWEERILSTNATLPFGVNVGPRDSVFFVLKLLSSRGGRGGARSSSQLHI
eukprot:TRINITY_DN61358_c0_g1_i1.p1 TRINITY_DN61358_c0_g1~~TRINITY_DN61358_c0_g1_i1.p1  ORF type:complete len:634 (-),score=72.30 TRINITY_DN61358_c0_g1_i1:63-1922(-)